METSNTEPNSKPELTPGVIWSEMLGYMTGILSGLFAAASLRRGLEQVGNRDVPNELLDLGSLSESLRRSYITTDFFNAELLSTGLNAERAGYLAALAHPLLQQNDLIVGFKRGTISQDDFNLGMSQLGFDSKQSAVFVNNFNQLLGSADVIQAELRGLSGSNSGVDFSTDVLAQGYTPERLDLLRALVKVLPSLQDLEGFAAWSVTDESFAAAMQLDSGLPDDFVANASKLGVTSDLASKYWRSHWEAPPLFMAKTLFQTGQFSEAQLKQLMQVYMIAPAFRDSIIAAFYKQPSEAQIKQMLTAGIITAADVPKLYAGLGYTPDQTANLAKLLIAQVASPAAAEKTAAAARKEEYYGLNAGNVISSYEESIITRDQAAVYLGDLGEPADIIAVRLALADHKIATTAQKDEIAVTHDQYVTGFIDQPTAQNQLVQAGCSENQITHLFYKWGLEIQKTIKLPSKADLDAFLKKNIITQAQYVTQMQGMGYAQEWIDAYITLQTGAPPINP